MKEIFRRLRWLLDHRRFECELDEEILHHLAMKAAESGSAKAARRQFGNVVLIREESRAMWTGVFLEQLAQDIRYSLRMMAANPLFTAMAALSLALGIGANAAIYSFMDAILLRSLPVQHPEDLVVLNWRAKTLPHIVQTLNGAEYDEPGGGITSGNYPWAAYELLRSGNRTLANLFAFTGAGDLNAIVQRRAEAVQGEYVSGNFFSVLGVPVAAGRLIGDDDDRPAAPAVAVLSYDYWQERFAGDPRVAGQVISLNNAPFMIAGVSGPGFFGVSPQNSPKVFVPLHALPLLSANAEDAAARFSQRTFYWVEMMGRLRPGVRREQAQAELGARFSGFVSSTAATAEERKVLPSLWLEEGSSGLDALRRQYSKPLYVLIAMVALILAIACANLANLLLARAAARRREMAVRLSLGAGAWRVVRQMLTESLSLALLGGVLGIAVAAAGVRFITWLLSNGNPDFTLRAHLDWRLLGFTLLLAIATGLLFGLAPAMQATRIDVTPALKEARAGAMREGRRRRGIPIGIGRILLIAQIAISLIVAVAAGLFVRTLANLRSVELGFNSEHLLLFHVNARRAGYKDEALVRFYDDLQERLRAIPGVRNATASDMALVSNSMGMTGVTIPGSATRHGISVLWVGPEFFETMQIPILLGRAIDDRDDAKSPAVAVVNEVFAASLFPHQNPIGRTFGLGEKKNRIELEIAGVAKAARYSSLKREIPPVVYIAWRQADRTRLGNFGLTFELRAAGDPLAMANTVRRVAHEASPLVPLTGITTQSQTIDGTIKQERTFADLCSCFAVLALAIACVGLYGAMAYAVAKRTSEIGIRMALGAERRRIIWMILREVLMLTAAGLAIGFAVAWSAARLVASFLYAMKPHDPLALSIPAALLAGAAVTAGYAPAWRASRIDPMAALRHE